MSRRGEWETEWAGADLALAPRGRSGSTSTRGEGQVWPRTELGIWLLKADLSLTLLEQSSGQFWSRQKDFINSNRLSETVQEEQQHQKSFLILSVGSPVLIGADANSQDLKIFEDYPSNKCNNGHFGQGWKSIAMHPDLVFWLLRMARSLISFTE